jgi:superoxide dismutase, Fe-Mn family
MKHAKRFSIFFMIVALAVLVFFIFFYTNDVNQNEEVIENEVLVQQSVLQSDNKRYHVKEFAIVMGPKKFSNKQINDHKQLYAGYVNKRNEIEESLKTADKAHASNISYSIFRGLKLAETFTRNAVLLHELYFENIGTGTTMGQATKEAIINNFGSVEAFKENLMATALSARGWAIMCYNLDDKKIQNYLLDAHNEKVPVLTVPLLVVDTYEHAYMIDFGINRKEYLAILWDNINWDVVEERVKVWVV